MDEGEDYNHILGKREVDFITARDSFYMASVSETGWPYLQHRGGPVGFVQVLDNRTIGFADFSGNRQYVSVGNLKKDDRVALFLMDYPNRRRLKMLGRVRLVDRDEPRLADPDEYQAQVERGFLIQVEAFDWNCPQHITPRYTQSDIEEQIAPLVSANRALKALQTGTETAPPDALGEGPLDLVISGVRQLTPRVRAYELRDPGGAELPAVQAGAHLQVPFRLDDGRSTVRYYSICSNPARRDAYEIAVLREDEGSGGSRAVHETFNVGLRLHCGLPQNYFGLHADERPAVLIAGGIGITPIKAMAQALKARGTALQLHYAGRNGEEMAFRDRLQREFCQDLTVYRSADGERMDVEKLLASAPDDAVFYACGPVRLINAVSGVAADLNIDAERIRIEHFEASIPLDAKMIEVELHRSGKQLRVGAEQSILDAMLDAGVDATFGCRTGHCKSCAVKVLAGEPDHLDAVLTTEEREEERLMCPCVSRAQSGHLVIDI